MTTMPASEVRRLLKRSKYGVDQSESGKAARTHNGVVYASQAELKYAQNLDWLKRVGHLEDWFGQCDMPLTVNGVKVGVLRLDFKLLHKGGELEYVEIKGFRTPVYKLKEKLFRALYPEARLTVIDAKEVR